MEYMKLMVPNFFLPVVLDRRKQNVLKKETNFIRDLETFTFVLMLLVLWRVDVHNFLTFSSSDVDPH
jgi:hypothetical protein